MAKYKLGLTESHADIEHDAPPEHLLHEISNPVKQAKVCPHAGERFGKTYSLYWLDRHLERLNGKW